MNKSKNSWIARKLKRTNGRIAERERLVNQ